MNLSLLHLLFFLKMSLYFILLLQIDEEDFHEEQNSVSRLIQMLYNDDPEEMLKVLIYSSYLIQVSIDICSHIISYRELITI